MVDLPSPGPQSPVAPPEYARAAREQLTSVLPRLTPNARRVIELAQLAARVEDDNHVGTEHIVLGMLDLPECRAARVLAEAGITRVLFAEQRHAEEGPSPAGRIPQTPRANRILGLAGEIARSRGETSVSTAHLLLGAIAESEEWEASGRGGAHHLREAAAAVGRTLADLRAAAD